MNSYKKGSWGLLILIGILLTNCGEPSSNTDSTVFERLNSNYTGIAFSNDLKEDVTSLANVLDFD